MSTPGSPRGKRRHRVFYVNLPVRYIAANSPYLERFLEYHDLRLQSGDAASREVGPELGLELGLDTQAIESLGRPWHEALAARLRGHGAALAMHLPFQELSPGSVDPLIREASRRRLEMAFELARIYAPAHMVGHPVYNADSWDHEPERWAACCAKTWAGLLEKWPGHPPLFLENIFEQDPMPLALLMQELRKQGLRKTGICFDVGHWHSFSRGGKRRNLEEWVAALAPWIRHLHLHDNDGSGDEHKGLGLGAIDFGELFELLKAHDAQPGATFEPHTEEAFFQSLQYVREHPHLFSRLA